MADKTAKTAHDIHPLLQERWSPRAFADENVDAATVRSLLEAARWAASCFNEQPWRFLVSHRGDPGFEALVGCLGEANQRWAKHAPVLMLACAKTTFTRNDKPNRHALHDVGQAVATMTMQATELGLRVHQMAGFSSDAARKAFGIPEDFEPDVAIAIGYPGNSDSLPEELREAEEAPRTRKPHEEFAFGARWGEAL